MLLTLISPLFVSFNVATKKNKITCAAHIIFLLDSTSPGAGLSKL